MLIFPIETVFYIDIRLHNDYNCIAKLKKWRLINDISMV